MHTQFTNSLRCPIAKSRLRLASGEYDPRGIVHHGILESEEGRSYPIIRGIPRFVSTEHYSQSFGVEWNRWPRLQFDDQNVGRPMAGHTTRMWETITGASDADVRGRTIVEFGCGPGRFLDVVRRKGGKAVGIDLSLAVEAARQNFKDDPNVLIVQGDILNPPFADQSFDGGYTIGVLHHTPKPEDGLRALARVLKPGAWAACCVYPKGEFYDYPSVRRWRKITRSLRPSLGYGPPLIYSRIAARGPQDLPPLRGMAHAAMPADPADSRPPLARTRSLRRHHARTRLHPHCRGSGPVDANRWPRLHHPDPLVRHLLERYRSGHH